MNKFGKFQKTLLYISLLFSVAAICETKQEKLQEINTNVNIQNKNLYEKNTEINIQNREDSMQDKCFEFRKKRRTAEDNLERAMRSRSEEAVQKLRIEIQDIIIQEQSYCQ